jgi:hypothetical protein
MSGRYDRRYKSPARSETHYTEEGVANKQGGFCTSGDHDRASDGWAHLDEGQRQFFDGAFALRAGTSEVAAAYCREFDLSGGMVSENKLPQKKVL